MIELKLLVWDKDGGQHFIFDYLLEKIAYKLRHFAESVGILDKYKTGEFSALDCEAREGRLELTIQQGAQKPEGGYYPDKNSVKDYLAGEKKEVVDLNHLKEDKFDDDIPF